MAFIIEVKVSAMSKVFFPLHLNGGNRGCEAIAKGTALLLEEPKENLVGLCNDVALDNRLGVSSFVSLVPSPSLNKFKLLLRKAHRLFCPQHSKHMKFVYKQTYDDFLKKIPADGIVFSTGGDMYCYGDNEAVYTARFCQERGLKTALWGCSIGEKNLTPKKMDTLKNFDLIYVRDSLTEHVLHSHGINNTICYPDPAFILEPEKITLPSFFDANEVIGINLSRFVFGNNLEGMNMMRHFMDYLLKETDLHIMLVPHVLWRDQDDRVISNDFMKIYSNTGRVHLFDSNCFNYCEIRYAISKCRYFVGARTHSVISAYSTCVPTIALGYSIKSKGIAKDLELDEKYVVDCTNNCYESKITESFLCLRQMESDVKRHMEDVMPKYKKRLLEIKTVYKKFLTQ